MSFQVGQRNFDPPVIQNTYLSIDGVDDGLKVANGIAYNKVVMDVTIPTPPDSNERYLIDSVARASGGYERYSTSWQGNMSPTGLIFDQRTLVTAQIVTPYTNGISFFKSYASASYFKADAFNIKLYNDTILVGHYDMSTGTVLDQSENGNHAILVGGTWTNDNGDTLTNNLGMFDFDTNISNYAAGQTYTFTVASGSRSAFDLANVKVGDYITSGGLEDNMFCTITAINGYTLTVFCHMTTTDGTPAQWANEYIIRIG